MRTPAKARIEIGVDPYDDGRGYAFTVEAERLTEDGKMVERILIKQGFETCLLLRPDRWPMLRAAVDRALNVVFKGKG